MSKGNGRIPIERWGKDHWSLVAYVECRCVDNRGTIDFDHLRCNPDKHPHYVGRRANLAVGFGLPKWEGSNGTRLKGYWTKDGKTDSSRQIPDHDDWDALDDLEAEGVAKNVGTGINPLFEMTAFGSALAAELRKHKAGGGQYAGFSDKLPDVLKRLR